MAFLASITLSAQEATEVQMQKENQKKEQTRIQKDKQDNQGQTVSTVAKETPSGPGKGQVVSQTAQAKKDAKKANKEAKKANKVNKVSKENKVKDARGPKVGQAPSRGPARSGGQGKR